MRASLARPPISSEQLPPPPGSKSKVRFLDSPRGGDIVIVVERVGEALATGPGGPPASPDEGV